MSRGFPLPAVLVVIDLQKDLCYDERRRSVFDQQLPDVKRLIDAFVAAGRPVVFTRFELDPDDTQFDRFGDKYCVRGSVGAEFVDEIDVSRGTVITKIKYSAFYGTPLEDMMSEHRARTVVLAGLQTQICVLTTAADAFNRGYEVVAAREAVISTREEVRQEALDWISKYVGTVLTVDEIATML